MVNKCFVFVFLRKLPNCFQHGFTILHYHHQRMRVPVLHSCQYLVWSFFFYFVILIMVSHYDFKLCFPNGFKHIFMCLFLYIIEVSVQNFPHFFNGWLVFLLLSFKISLYILETSFIRYILCKHFLPVCGLPIYSLDCFFQKLVFHFDKT